MSDIPDDIFKIAQSIPADIPSRVQTANRDFATAVIAVAIKAERDRDGWQPIETAPKMKRILLFAVIDTEDGVIKNWKMATGTYLTGHNAWDWEGDILKEYDYQPTHWQPLPKPPVQS